MSEVKSQLNPLLNKCTSCGEEVTFAYHDRVPTHDPICGDLTCHNCAQGQAVGNGFSCVHHPRSSSEQKDDPNRPLAAEGWRAPALFLQDLKTASKAPMAPKAPLNDAGAPGGIDGAGVEEANVDDGGESEEVEVGLHDPNAMGDGQEPDREEPAHVVSCDVCVEALILSGLPSEVAHPSTVYCLKCEKNLCSRHADGHNNMFGDHILVNPQDKTAVTSGHIPLFGSCSVHVGTQFVAVDMNAYSRVCGSCVYANPSQEYMLATTAGPSIRKTLDEMWFIGFEAKGLRKVHSNTVLAKIVAAINNNNNNNNININNTSGGLLADARVVSFPRVMARLRCVADMLETLCEEIKAVGTMINDKVEGWRVNNNGERLAYQIQHLVDQHDVHTVGVFGGVINSLISMITTRNALYGTLNHVRVHIFEDVQVEGSGHKDVGAALKKKRGEREMNAESVGKDLYMLKTLLCVKEMLMNDDQPYLATLSSTLVKNKVMGLREGMSTLKSEFKKGGQGGKEGQVNQEWETQELACARCIHNILPLLHQVVSKDFWVHISLHEYGVGERVEVMWSCLCDHEYHATVTDLNIDGTYDLVGDDGNVDKAVPENVIRRVG